MLDKVATCLILVAAGMLDAFVSLIAVFATTVGDGCEPGECNPALVSFGSGLGMVAPTAVLVVTLILMLRRFAKRRRTWWVALAGLAAMLIVWGIGMGIAFAGAAPM